MLESPPPLGTSPATDTAPAATAISPCPFCYSRRMHMASALFTHKVVCEQCRSSGPQRRSAGDAIQEWNELSYRVWGRPVSANQTVPAALRPHH